ncbi:hypothetical protein GCM10008915_49730 [Bifidobacterium pullorum subsp. gallinarum]
MVFWHLHDYIDNNAVGSRIDLAGEVKLLIPKDNIRVYFSDFTNIYMEAYIE